MIKFYEWEPMYDGHKPPYWENEMPWALAPSEPLGQPKEPSWIKGTGYSVPVDAVRDKVDLEWMLSELRRYTAEQLAVYGITIAYGDNYD
jgi:hypothetical protein